MDLDWEIELVLQGHIIPEDWLSQYCEWLKEIFFNEANVVRVNSPIIVCGDIHG